MFDLIFHVLSMTVTSSMSHYVEARQARVTKRVMSATRNVPGKSDATPQRHTKGLSNLMCEIN